MSIRARALRRAVKAFVVGPEATTEEQREAMDRVDKLPRPRNMDYTDVTVGGIDGLRAKPTGLTSDRHILYLHGGGYVLGSPISHIGMAARLARRAAATVTVIDYRLAPEHPYPAAIDDCAAAYEGLLAETPAESICIAGDSAGGGATVATLARLRATGSPRPGCAYLISPWVDLTSSGESMTTRAEADPMIDAAFVGEVAAQYAADTPLDHPGVSPLFEDLTGMPPMLIQVGDDEVLLSDSTRLAERARGAGVEVELEVADGMWHVYQAFARYLPEADKALDRAAIFISAHTRASAPTPLAAATQASPSQAATPQAPVQQ